MNGMIEYSPALVFSALLSLSLEWIPALDRWWAGLSSAKRASLNALGVALISIAVMLYQCQWGETCPANVGQTVIDFLLVALLSLGVNQGTHQAFQRGNFGKSL